MGDAALVSGGASGLGRAVVEALAGRGYRVVALDVDPKGVPVLPAVDAVEADVTDAAAVEAALSRLGSARLRVAVCCAGIAPARRLLGRTGPHDLETFVRTLSVNTTGTFNVMRLAAARMAASDPDGEGGRGVIVATASIAAQESQIGQCAYAASKGAVWSMVLPAARELAAHGIRVVGIAPGVFATPMIAVMPDSVQSSLAATVTFPRRFGEPSEFASLVLHVIDNVYLNGSVIRLDAGLRMGS